MAVTTARISARIPADLLLSAAYQSGVPGNIGKSGMGRYAVARLAGYDHFEAMKIARVEPKPRTLMANSTPTAIDIPVEVLEKARAALPEGMEDNQSFMVRYALALLNGYTEDDARKVAHMKLGRPAMTK